MPSPCVGLEGRSQPTFMDRGFRSSFMFRHFMMLFSCLFGALRIPPLSASAVWEAEEAPQVRESGVCWWEWGGGSVFRCPLPFPGVSGRAPLPDCLCGRTILVPHRQRDFQSQIDCYDWAQFTFPAYISLFLDYRGEQSILYKINHTSTLWSRVLLPCRSPGEMKIYINAKICMWMSLKWWMDN